MKKVLLNGSLIINSLEEKTEAFSKYFGYFWQILNEDSDYQGYIKTIEFKKISDKLEEIYDGNLSLVKSIVDDFFTVLNICDDDKNVSFDYVVTGENIITSQQIYSNENIVSISLFLMLYEIQKKTLVNIDSNEIIAGETISEPVLNIETDLVSELGNNDTIPGEENDFSDGHDGSGDYFLGDSRSDSLTGIGKNDIITGKGNDLLDGRYGSEDSLSGDFGIDSLAGLGNNDTIPGEENDFSDGHGGSEDSLSGDFGIDSLAGLGNNDIIPGEGNDFLDGYGDDDNYPFGSDQ